MDTLGYAAYGHELAHLAADVARGIWDPVEQDIHHALNGQASERLRTLVALEDRRSSGAFFTGGDLRSRVSELLIATEISSGFWDPACGAGDLLLAAANHLPLGQSFPDTLKMWGQLLHGCDLAPEFITVSRLRLFLSAAARHGGKEIKARRHLIEVEQIFPELRVADGQKSLGAKKGYEGHVLLNPPFSAVQADRNCKWAGGTVSQAAVFLLSAAKALAVGASITAILPDVLRSGSRYERWREEVESILDVIEVTPYGQFDAFTDVDVFLFRAKRKVEAKPTRLGDIWWPTTHAEHQVKDAFDVRVGTVVDNRDPHIGPESLYLTARNLPGSSGAGDTKRTRQFAGRLFDPPFVAIRRTSRPGPRSGGQARAAGVLVTGDRPIAVDNHLIIAKPLRGGIRTCKRLLQVLESPQVCSWLDKRIRCRHLTVRVVKSIPWS